MILLYKSDFWRESLWNIHANIIYAYFIIIIQLWNTYILIWISEIISAIQFISSKKGDAFNISE